ncbi:MULTISPECIES: hypothetical protein [unclassified Mycobacterium]|uniref:hypothetical protein n=1 Tax=unclassified Mycobacterium TaxID=2642494 RepID=UPI000994726B|nr:MULTISPECIES: hypothetical protein [unclassified Mycobacterium]
MAFLEDRTSGAHPPNVHPRVELVKDAFATMAALDLDGYLKFFSDDVEHVLAPVPKIKGKENLWIRFRIKATMRFVDDKVVFWRDSVDYPSLIGWSLRGLAGTLIPRLRPQPPVTG